MLNAYNADVIARITLGLEVVILIVIFLLPFYFLAYKSFFNKQNNKD